MQRIDSATRVIDLHGAGKDGWTAGNPLNGTPATSQTAAMWNALQEEISGVIEAWSGALNPASYIQLRLAIEAKITAMIAATGVTGKVSNAGDTMTGALLIALAALQLTLRNSDNTAALKDHLRLFRGSGAGTRASIQTLGDAANGITEIDFNFLSAADALVKAFKFKNSGRLELGADPTLALEATTKQYVDAVIVTQASGAEVLAGALTNKYLSPASALAGLLGAGGDGASDYVIIPYRDKTTGARKNLIIQWGSSAANITTETTATITFPLTFPNACNMAMAVGANTATSSNQNTVLQSVSKSASQYVIYNNAMPSSPSLVTNGYDWFAIGF